jgi:HK97 gp10 family phage protein
MQDLLDSMEGLPLVLRRILIARSLREAAQPIAARMRETAPDDPETPGSRIRESIGISVTNRTAEGATAEIGPSKHGFPAIFAELGTPHQPARPFIQPAFDQTQEHAYELLSEVLGEGIEEEFYKLK